MTQKYTSAGTSNKQVPAILRLIDQWAARKTNDFSWRGVGNVLDYGGGKYDLLTERLAARGVVNWVYDPYNRTAAHNVVVCDYLQDEGGADIGICSNMLNVIKEPRVRSVTLALMANLVKSDAFVFFTVNEGDKSSRGRETPRGWQANRPTKSYVREIRKLFTNVRRAGKLIIATNGNR